MNRPQPLQGAGELDVTGSARTTPKSDTKAIGKVVVSDRIVLHAYQVFSEGFSGHPLSTQSVTIRTRLVLKEESRTYYFTFEKGNKSFSRYIEVTKADLKALEMVQVWADPLGHAALYDSTTSSLALGRLTYNKDKFKVVEDGISNYPLTFQVLKGVAQFIVDEMNKNVNDPDVLACKADLDKAAALEKEAKDAGLIERTTKEAKATNLKNRAENRWATKVHTNSGVTGVLADIWFLGGGEWDHKPIINPVWGAQNRLGDRSEVYYYDIWSNIHYGYVGRAAGFTEGKLKEGASTQQQVDSGTEDDSADVESIAAGFALYQSGKPVTVEQVVAVVEAHPGWTYEKRKAIWDAAKKKK